MRRLVAALAAAALAAVLSACVVSGTGGDTACTGTDDSLFVLAAQAVPSATLLPCVSELPAGWIVAGVHTIDGRFRFWLGSDRAGPRAVQVTLEGGCDTSAAVEVAPSVDEAGTRRFEEPISLQPAFTANRYYTFAGGCVEVAYRFTDAADSTLALEADQAIGFRPRQPIVDDLADEDLVLCGAGAPDCPGDD